VKPQLNSLKKPLNFLMAMMQLIRLQETIQLNSKVNLTMTVNVTMTTIQPNRHRKPQLNSVWKPPKFLTAMMQLMRLQEPIQLNSHR
jgi:hypothetical protein